MRIPSLAKKFLCSEKNKGFFFFFFYFSAVSGSPNHFMSVQYTDRLVLYNTSLMSCGLKTGRGKRKRRADAFPPYMHFGGVGDFLGVFHLVSLPHCINVVKCRQGWQFGV